MTRAEELQTFLLELAMRSRVAQPKNKFDIAWFNEGLTDPFLEDLRLILNVSPENPVSCQVCGKFVTEDMPCDKDKNSYCAMYLRNTK